MTKKSNYDLFRRLEDNAVKLNECIQMLDYITQDLENISLNIKTNYNCDGLNSRIMTLLYRVYEDSKEIREDLYSITDNLEAYSESKKVIS